MTTFPIEDTEVYSDDNFTLAFGSPDEESEESTPSTLAHAFALQSLEGLLESLNLHPLRYMKEIDKLESAINIKREVLP